MKNNSTRRKVKRALQRVRDKYNIHNRLFNGRDFYRICKGENIHLMNRQLMGEQSTYAMPERFPNILGYLAKGRGETMIWLRCFFVGRFDVHTAFHELGHHFCKHSGYEVAGLAKREGYNRATDPGESEADLFAELATGKKVRRGNA